MSAQEFDKSELTKGQQAEADAAEVCEERRARLDPAEIDALRAFFLLLDRLDREERANGE